MKNSTMKKWLIASIVMVVVVASAILGLALTDRNKKEEGKPDETLDVKWDGVTTIAPSGSGTYDDPYRISSAENLAYLATLDKYEPDAVYVLKCDIDLNGHDWTPIGHSIAPFTGEFYGVDHKITGIGSSAENFYNSNRKEAPSLFGYAYGASISNLTVEYAYKEAYGSYGYGGIVRNAVNNVSISQCANITKSISFYDVYSYEGFGGLVGMTNGKLQISDSYSLTNINFNGMAYGVGGIVGVCTDGGNGAKNSYVAGSVTVGNTSEVYSGSIVGYGYSEDPVLTRITLTNVFALNDEEGSATNPSDKWAKLLSESDNWTIDPNENGGLPILKVKEYELVTSSQSWSEYSAEFQKTTIPSNPKDGATYVQRKITSSSTTVTSTSYNATTGQTTTNYRTDFTYTTILYTYNATLETWTTSGGNTSTSSSYSWTEVTGGGGTTIHPTPSKPSGSTEDDNNTGQGSEDPVPDDGYEKSKLYVITMNFNGGTYNGDAVVTDDFYNVWWSGSDTYNYDIYDGLYGCMDYDIAGGYYSYGDNHNKMPTRDGYKFVGYTDVANPSDSDTVYTSCYGLSSGATVYAKWVALYKVRYNANGGDGTMADQEHVYGKSLALTTNAFTRAGYSFDGWATSASGSVVYANGATVTNLASTGGAVVNLYAVWSEGTEITLVTYGTYSKDDSLVEVEINGANSYTARYTYGDQLRLPDQMYDDSNETMAFLGYHTSNSSTQGELYFRYLGQFTETTLYAYWTEDPGNSGDGSGDSVYYGVKYDAQGGTVDGGSIAYRDYLYAYNYDSSQEEYVYEYDIGSLDITDPTRDGYTFKGWYTGVNGTGEKFEDGEHWKEVWDENEGSYIDDGLYYWVTGSDGREYGYWDEDAYNNGTGPNYMYYNNTYYEMKYCSSTGVLTENTTTTLYAHWEIIMSMPSVTVSETSLSMKYNEKRTFRYSASVDGTFSITSSNASIAKVSGYTASVSAGTTYTCTILGTGVGTANITIAFTPSDTERYYTPANISVSVTTSKASFTPTVSMNGYTYAGTKNNPSISGNTSGGTVTYYYNTVASNSGGTAWSSVTSSTSLSAGTYYIYAVVAGTTNYNSATSSAVAFTISKAVNPISVSAGSSLVYGQTNSVMVNVSGAQGAVWYSVDSEITSSNYSSGTKNVPTVSARNASTYTVYWYCEGNTNYYAKQGYVSVTISRAGISPSVSMSGYTYGGTKSSPSVSGNTGGGTVTYYYNTVESNSGGKAWSNVTSSTSLSAKTYYMYAVIAQTTNYNGATTSAVAFTISKATPNVTVSASSVSFSAGDSASVTISSNVAGKYTSSSSSSTVANVSNLTSSQVSANSSTGFSIYGYSTGNVTITLTFTPSDTTNYNTVTKTISVAVVAKNITVTYEANGGSVSPTYKSLSVSSTSQTYGTLPTPTREGYTFNGWYTASSGGTKVTSISKISPISDHTLYAQWTANSYTVTFDANGGSVTTSSKSVTYDSTYGTLPTPTRDDGSEFEGWYTASSGGTQVTSSTVVKTAGNHTLYAHWNVPLTLTIKHGHHYGTPTHTTGLTVTGDGCTISGSSTGCNNIVVKHFYSTTPITITVERTNTSYNYTLNTNASGSWVDNKNTFTYSWTPTADASFSVHVIEHITMTAVAKTGISSASVGIGTYTANSSTTSNSATGWHNADYGFYANVANGYKFKGWYDNANGTGTALSTSTSFNYSESLGWTEAIVQTSKTLYAFAEPTDYTITYDMNGGSSVSSGSYTFSTSSQTVSLNSTATKQYYDLAGYTITSNTGGQTSTVSGTTLTIPGGAYGNITVKAVWSEHVYKTTITYGTYYDKSASNTTVAISATGGTLASSAISYGTSTTLTQAYSTSAISITVSVTDTSCYYYFEVVTSLGSTSYSGSRTLSWTPNSDATIRCELIQSFKIYAYAGTGAETVIHQKKWGANDDWEENGNGWNTYQGCGIRFKSTASAGYGTFKGWYTNASGTGTPISMTYDESSGYWVYCNYGNAGATTRNAGLKQNLTVYAVWTPGNLTVTFDANGGSVSTSSKSVTYLSTYGDLPTPTREGYIFKGWANNYFDVVGFVNFYRSEDGDAHGSTYWPTFTYDSTNGRWVLKVCGPSGYNSNKWNETGNYALFPYSLEVGKTYKVSYYGYTNRTDGNSTSGISVRSKTGDSIVWSSVNTTTRTLYSYKFTVDSSFGGFAPAYNYSDWAYLDTIKIEEVGATSGNVTATTAVTTAINHELVAVWEICDYTVTLNANGGTFSSASGWSGTGSTISTSYDVTTSKQTSLPTPTRTGYTLSSWNTSANGSGTAFDYYGGGKTGSVTYYAIWTANDISLKLQTLGSGTYNVAYNQSFNGASNGTGSYTYSVLEVVCNDVAVTASNGAYNGLSLSGTKISGTPTKAGSYRFTVRATDNNSGKYDNAYIYVTINKAAGHLTLSSSSVTLTYPTTSSVTISSSHGVTIGVETSNSGVAVADWIDEVDGIIFDMVVLSPQPISETSTCVVTVTCNETDNYTSATATINVTVIPGTINVTVSNNFGGNYVTGTTYAYKVTSDVDGATLKYGSTSSYGTQKTMTKGTEYALLSTTSAGNYTLYYEISKPGYATVKMDNLSLSVGTATISGSVSITGTAMYDQTLRANVTNTSGATLNYQWYYNSSNSTSGGTSISGATGASYTIGKGLVGKYIYVAVTFSKTNYTTRTISAITSSKVVKAELETPTASWSHGTNGALSIANCEEVDAPSGISVTYEITLYLAYEGSCSDFFEEPIDCYTGLSHDFYSTMKTDLGAEYYYFEVEAISSDTANCESSYDRSVEVSVGWIYISFETGIEYVEIDGEEIYADDPVDSHYVVIIEEETLDIEQFAAPGYYFFGGKRWSRSSSYISIEDICNESTTITAGSYGGGVTLTALTAQLAEPNVSISPSDDQEITFNETSVTLTAIYDYLLDDLAGISYKWYINGSTIVGYNSSYTVGKTNTSVGTHTFKCLVTITDSVGKTASAYTKPVPVTVKPTTTGVVTYSVDKTKFIYKNTSAGPTVSQVKVGGNPYSYKLEGTTSSTTVGSFETTIKITEGNYEGSSVKFSWTQEYQSLLLKADDGTTTVKTVYPKHDSTSLYGDSFGGTTASITKPTKTGYNFKGYYTGQNGTGSLVINENCALASNYTYESDEMSVYPKWEAIPIQITSSGDITTNYPNSATTTIKASNGSGTWTYTLDGQNASKFTISPTTATTGNAILTLKAESGAGTYYVTVTATDANGTTASVNVTGTVNLGEFTPTVSMSGYTYAGTKSEPSISGNTSGGTVTYYYNTTNSNSNGKAWTSVTSSTSLNAGTYYMYAVVSANGDYKEVKSAPKSFVIERATPTLSVQSSISATYGTSETLSISYNGDGTLNATSDNTTYITASLNSKTLTLSCVKHASGTTIVVTISATQGTNYKAASTTISVTTSVATLSAPETLEVTGDGLVKWSQVPNADGYEISIDGSTYTSATWSSSGYNYLNTIVSATGTRTVFVRATASNSNYGVSGTAKSVNVNVYTVRVSKNISADVYLDRTATKSQNVTSLNFISYGTAYLFASEEDGYTFTSWTTSNGATITNSTSQNASATDFSQYTTITANYTANSYTVTADAQGGYIPITTGWTIASTNQTATKSVTYGLAYGTLPTPIRAGYTFVRWYCTGVPTSSYYPEGRFFVMPIESSSIAEYAFDHVLLAQWTANSYTVSFNTNGGTGSYSDITVTMGGKYTLPSTNPTRDGYVFKGWANNYFDVAGLVNFYMSEDGNANGSTYWPTFTYDSTNSRWVLKVCGPSGYNSNKWNETGNYALFPYSLEVGKTYKVSYYGYTNRTDGNSTSGISVRSKTGDSIVWSSVNTTTRTLYSYKFTVDSSFGGFALAYNYSDWAYLDTIKIEEVGATSGNVTATTAVTTAVDHELVAVWESKTATATIKNLSGTDVEGTLSASVNGGTATTGTTSSGTYGISLTDLKVGDTITITATKNGNTECARWTKGTTYNDTNLGSGAEYTYTVTAEDAETGSIDITACYLYRIEAIAITNYSTSASSTGGVISSGGNALGQATYIITGTFTRATTSSIYAKAYSGYRFIKWSDTNSDWTSTIPNGTDNPYTVSVTLPSSYTFYALFLKEYTLTANANGGTIDSTTGWTGTDDSATKAIVKGEAYGTLPTITRTGYTFKGWFTAKTGGVEVSADTTSTGANATIYARWEQNKYTVTFDANGGSVTPTSKEVYYNSNYGTLPEPERIGYFFNGWKLDGNKINDYTTVATASNHTLTADWTPKTYNITFDANSGTIVGSLLQEYTIETETFVISQTATRTGYDFAGWRVTAVYGNPKCNGETIAKGDIITQIDKGSYGEIDLVATWTAIAIEFTGATFEDVYYGNMVYNSKYFINGATGGSGSYTYKITKVTLDNAEISADTSGKYNGLELEAEPAGSVICGYALWAGKYVFSIRATDSVNGLFADADYVLTVNQREITISAASQTVVWPNTPNTTYSASTASATNIYSQDSLTGLTLTASTTNATNSGTITPSGAKITRGGEDVTVNYNITYVKGNLTIKALKIKAEVITGHTVITKTFDGDKLVETIINQDSFYKLYHQDVNGNWIVSNALNNGVANQYVEQTPDSAEYDSQWTDATKVIVAFNLKSGVSSSNVDLTTPTIELNGKINAISVEVKFDANGGTVSPETITYAYGTKDLTYATVPVAVRSGFTFAGWYTSKTGGNNIDDATLFTNGTSHTLYALWTMNAQEITGESGYTGVYDGNNHTISISHDSFTGVTYSYQWYKGGISEANKIAGATSTSMNVKNVSDNGNYYCVMSINDGSVTLSANSSAIAVSITASQIKVTAVGAYDPSYTGTKQYLEATYNGQEALNASANLGTHYLVTSTNGGAVPTVTLGAFMGTVNVVRDASKNVIGYTGTSALSIADTSNYALVNSELKLNCKKNPIAITVTIADQTIEYGQKISSVPAKVSTTSGAFASGDSITSVTLSQSTTGVTTNGTITCDAISITSQSGGSDRTVSYNITYTVGKLVITQKAVTVTANNQTITYGENISKTTSDVSVNGLVTGDSLTGITFSQSTEYYTKAGTITLTGAVIKNNGSDVTKNYSITYASGTLTINKKALTITAKGGAYNFGGAVSQTVNDVTHTDLAQGDVLSDIKFDIVNASVTTNGTITPKNAKIMRGSVDVTESYDISYVAGTLTANAVTPTITLTPYTTYYDRTAKAYPTANITVTGVNNETLTYLESEITIMYAKSGNPYGESKFTDQGTYNVKVTISSKGNYLSCSAETTLTIKPAEIRVDVISGYGEGGSKFIEVPYDGNNYIKQADAKDYYSFVAVNGVTPLTSEFTMSDFNGITSANETGATAQSQITLSSTNYKFTNGTQEFVLKLNFKRMRLELTSDNISGYESTYPFDGAEHKPTLVVKRTVGNTANKVLTLNTDYTVVYHSDGKTAGEHKITVTGIGNFKGEVEITFTVSEKSISGATFATINPITYTGAEVTVDLTNKVSLGGVTLVQGTDYNISGYANNINAGTATVSITGIGNYSGTASTTFVINKKDITITANNQTITYGGTISKTVSDVSVATLISGHSLSEITLSTEAENVTTSGVISVSGAKILASGSDVTSNYNISYVAGKVTINEKEITGSVTITGSTVYGSTLTAQITGAYAGEAEGYQYQWYRGSVSEANKIAGATTSTLIINSQNVGITKVVGATFVVRITGTGNFKGYRDSSASSAVTAKKISWASAPVVANKYYDATTGATISTHATINTSDIETNDTVSLNTSAVATFGNANVGSGKAVNITGYALTGTHCENYYIDQPTNITASINKLLITVNAKGNFVLGGTQFIEKDYDGGTSVTATLTLNTHYELSSNGTTIPSEVTANNNLTISSKEYKYANVVNADSNYVTVKFKFNTSSSNYGFSDGGNEIKINGKINPKSCAVVWTVSDAYVYTGLEQSVTAKFTDVNSNAVTMSVTYKDKTSGASKQFLTAGTYVAEASYSTTNYTFTNTTKELVMKQASIEFTWNGGNAYSKPYTGTAQGPSVSYTGVVASDNTDAKLKVTYADNSFTDVGDFTAVASISGTSSTNYELKNSTFSWKITSTLIEKPVISESEYVTYNGTSQSWYPTNYNDIKTLINITNNTHTDADDYTITVSLVDSENYSWKDGSKTNLSLTWKIKKVKAENTTLSLLNSDNTSFSSLDVKVKQTINVKAKLQYIGSISNTTLTAEFTPDDIATITLGSITSGVSNISVYGKKSNVGTTVTVKWAGDKNHEGVQANFTLVVTSLKVSMYLVDAEGNTTSDAYGDLTHGIYSAQNSQKNTFDIDYGDSTNAVNVSVVPTSGYGWYFYDINGSKTYNTGTTSNLTSTSTISLTNVTENIVIKAYFAPVVTINFMSTGDSNALTNTQVISQVKDAKNNINPAFTYSTTTTVSGAFASAQVFGDSNVKLSLVATSNTSVKTGYVITSVTFGKPTTNLLKASAFSVSIEDVKVTSLESATWTSNLTGGTSYSVVFETAKALLVEGTTTDNATYSIAPKDGNDKVYNEANDSNYILEGKEVYLQVHNIADGYVFVGFKTSDDTLYYRNSSDFATYDEANSNPTQGDYRYTANFTTGVSQAVAVVRKQFAGEVSVNVESQTASLTHVETGLTYNLTNKTEISDSELEGIFLEGNYSLTASGGTVSILISYANGTTSTVTADSDGSYKFELTTQVSSITITIS